MTPTRPGFFSVFRQRKPTRAARRPRGRGARVEPVEDKVRYLTNRGVPPPLIEKLRPLAHIGRRRDLEWLARRITAQVASAPIHVAREVENGMLEKAEIVLDWIVNARPNYLGMAFDEAEAESETWHAKRSKTPSAVRKRDLIGKLSRDVVYDFGDGWAWVKIPLDEYGTEGTIMGFSLSAAYKQYEAYSLRGPDNAPHVSMTLRPPSGTSRRWSLKEIKGKSNARPPAPQYSRRTLTWLLTRPFGRLDVVTAMGAGDLGRIIAAVLPSEAAQNKAARRIFARRATLVWAKEFRQGSADFPVVPATLPEMVQALAKTKSLYTFMALADAVDARVDQLTAAVQTPGTMRWKTAHLELRVLDTPRLQRNLHRRARSKKVRDRLLAAALLSVDDLGLLAGEPNDKVRAIAGKRLGVLVENPKSWRYEVDVVALAVRLLKPAELDTWVADRVASKPDLAQTWTVDYPELLPGILLHAPLATKVELLHKTGDLARIAAIGRSIANTLDAATTLGHGDALWYSSYAPHPHWLRERVAKALGLDTETFEPVTTARLFDKRLRSNLRRHAKSPHARYRLLAAMLLPPKDLVLLAGDPSAQIEVLASMRLAPDVAEAFYKRARATSAKVGALGLMPKAAFRRHYTWHGDSDLVFASLERAVELGLPFDLSGFDEIDTIQFALQAVIERDAVKALSEKFMGIWYGPADPLAGGADPGEYATSVADGYNSVGNVMGAAAMKSLVRFAPVDALQLGLFSCDDYLDAPVYAWGHPEDAADVLSGDMWWCGGQGEWDGIDVPGWAEATYFLSRIAGHDPAESLRKTHEELGAFAQERVERLSEPDLDLFNQLEKDWRAFAKAQAAAS